MKRNYTVFVIVMCLVVLFIASACVQAPAVLANVKVNSSYALSAKDSDILKYYRKPSLQDNFDDDTVNVILKSGYSGQIGFDDFKTVNTISNIEALTYNLKTICHGSNEKFLIAGDRNAIIVLTLSTHDKNKVLKVIKKLQEFHMVLVAEPNYIYEIESFSTPNDPGYSMQWGCNGEYGINVEGAWDYTQGDYSVKVGLFEVDVDYNHEELVGHISSGNLPDDVRDPDEIDHGTHVAGIIGANTNNNLGVAGISKCSMYMLDRRYFVNSLQYAAANDIKIINASFGYRYSAGNYVPYNSTHYAAISEYDGLLICAAGNDNVNNDDNPLYPASYDLPNIISVGSMESDGSIRSSSNYGGSSVDIFAPGGQILSSYSNNEYGLFSGTSMAAPHVTGVAALLSAKYPNLTASEIKCTILDNADKSSAMSGYCVVGGYLNAYKALSNPHNHSNVISYEKIDQGTHRETCVCGAVTVKPHAYSLYRYVDGRYHKATCKCGNKVQDMHVIKGGASAGQTCLLCHGKVDLGITPYPNALNARLVTDNGSYVLPNGIIVLAEQDVDAYFNGTLKFKVNSNLSVA